MPLAQYMVDYGYVPPDLFNSGKIDVGKLANYLVNEEWAYERPYWVPKE